MLQDFAGLKRHDTESATVGDIIVSGIPDITIGDTICDKDFPEPIPLWTLTTDYINVLYGYYQSFCRQRGYLRHPTAYQKQAFP